MLVPKEALIGEHNLKLLLTGHKESIDWQSLLGHSSSASPRTRVITRISYSSWVITITYYMSATYYERVIQNYESMLLAFKVF